MSFTRIAQSSGGSSDTNSAVASAIDSTGATTLFAFVSTAFGVAPTVSDSKSNTWHALTAQDTGTTRGQWFWCHPSSVGTGHTCTATTTAGFPSVFFLAYSGGAASPFDVESGAHNASAASLASGSVTPASANSLLLSGVSAFTSTTATVDAGFTRLDQISFISGQHIYGGIAELIETSIAAKNTTWTPDVTGHIAVCLTAFKLAPVSPAITDTSPLTNGTVGVPLTHALHASGGTGPYTWRKTAGTASVSVTGLQQYQNAELLWVSNSLAADLGGGQEWPRLLQADLAALGITVDVVNGAVSGQTSQQQDINAETQIDPFYDSARRCILFGCEIGNDIYYNGSVGYAATAVANFQTLLDNRPAGFEKVYISTQDRGGVSTWGTEPAFRTELAAARTLGPTSWQGHASRYVDMMDDPHLADCTDLTYFLTDKTHNTRPTGTSQWASTILAAMESWGGPLITDTDLSAGSRTITVIATDFLGVDTDPVTLTWEVSVDLSQFPGYPVSGIPYYHYDMRPRDWPTVTDTYVFEDEGQDFNERTSNPPRIWDIEFIHGLSRDQTEIFDIFWEGVRISQPFSFVDKYGYTYENVRIQSYSRSHDAHKAWDKTVAFVLIQYSPTDPV